MEWHTLIERAVPFFPAAYNGAKDFIALPFNFVKAMPNSVYAFVVKLAIKENEKIPI
jgi:hypothetical protein